MVFISTDLSFVVFCDDVMYICGSHGVHQSDVSLGSVLPLVGEFEKSPHVQVWWWLCEGASAHTVRECDGLVFPPPLETVVISGVGRVRKAALFRATRRRW